MASDNVLFYCDDDDIELFYERYQHFFKKNVLLFSVNQHTISYLKARNAICGVKNGFSNIDKILIRLFSDNITSVEQDLISLAVKNTICSRTISYNSHDLPKFTSYCAKRINFLEAYLKRKRIGTVVVTDHIYSPALDFCIAAVRCGCRLLIRSQPYRETYAKAFKLITELNELYEHPWQVKVDDAKILINNVTSLNLDDRRYDDDFGGLLIACHRLNDMNLLYGKDWFKDYIDWLDIVLKISTKYFSYNNIFVRPHPTEGQRHLIDQTMLKYHLNATHIMDSSEIDWEFVRRKKLLILTIRGTIFLDALKRGVPAITTSKTRYTSFGEALFGHNPEHMSLSDLHKIFEKKKIQRISEFQAEIAKNIENFEADRLQFNYIW